jgi:hypothetical protein
LRGFSLKSVRWVVGTVGRGRKYDSWKAKTQRITKDVVGGHTAINCAVDLS